IHLNPVRANMVSDPATYPFSSHRAYLGLDVSPWLTTDFALSLLARELTRARDAYRFFVQAGIGITGENWLTGHPEEPRVLGDDRFLAGLRLERRLRCRLTLTELVDQVCREHSTEPADLAAPGRLRHHARLRAVVLDRALRLRIATLSDVARHFHRSTPGLSRSLQHYRSTEPLLFGGSSIDPE
ncbi:MAG: hypothetical protein ABL864_15535, partial [Terricaulis sp.]